MARDAQLPLVFWLDHQGEHYGKLVTAYRVNGIVPPISRKLGAAGGSESPRRGCRTGRR